MTMTFRLVTLRGLSADETQGQAKAIAQGPTVNVNGPTSAQASNRIYPIESFPVHIKFHRGDELAIGTTTNRAECCADGTPGQLTFDPFLALGQGFRTSTSVDNCLLLAQAVVRQKPSRQRERT